MAYEVAAAGFLLLSQWSVTVCLTLITVNANVLSASVTYLFIYLFRCASMVGFSGPNIRKMFLREKYCIWVSGSEFVLYLYCFSEVRTSCHKEYH